MEIVKGQAFENLLAGFMLVGSNFDRKSPCS